MKALASLKAAYDALVRQGVLVDDCAEFLRHEAPRFEVDRDNPRVELLVTKEPAE